MLSIRHCRYSYPDFHPCYLSEISNRPSVAASGGIEGQAGTSFPLVHHFGIACSFAHICSARHSCPAFSAIQILSGGLSAASCFSPRPPKAWNDPSMWPVWGSRPHPLSFMIFMRPSVLGLPYVCNTLLIRLAGVALLIGPSGKLRGPSGW